jgi:truncated hemoglobin YjbI
MNSHQFAAAMLEEEITGEPFPRVLLQMAKAFSNIDSDDKLYGRFAHPAVSRTHPC